MNVMGELALIFGVCLVGEGIAALLPVAFPASVIAMVLLMVLLLTGVVKERYLQKAAELMMVNMAFFFIPPFVGTLEYAELMKQQAVALLVVAGVTTPLVYLVTAWTVQGCMIWMKRRKKG